MNLLSPGRHFLECEMQARCHSWRWRWRSPQIALRCYACGCHMLWRNQGWKQLSVPHPNFCFLFDLISILPQPSPSSRPASRFLTAPGLCSAHFFSPPVPVSFPLSRTTAASTNHPPPPQCLSMEPCPVILALLFLGLYSPHL